jgi:hypothetical protein
LKSKNREERLNEEHKKDHGNSIGNGYGRCAFGFMRSCGTATGACTGTRARTGTRACSCSGSGAATGICAQI